MLFKFCFCFLINRDHLTTSTAKYFKFLFYLVMWSIESLPIQIGENFKLGFSWFFNYGLIEVDSVFVSLFCRMNCVVDAIFGALGLPDIGQIFPDLDLMWKGAASSIFIKEAVSFFYSSPICSFRCILKDLLLSLLLLRFISLINLS